MLPPAVLLLHCRVGQLLSVDDQVSVVRGLQGKAPVADPTAVASLFVLLHDVLQVLFPLGKRQLDTQEDEAQNKQVLSLLALSCCTSQEIWTKLT